MTDIEKIIQNELCNIICAWDKECTCQKERKLMNLIKNKIKEAVVKIECISSECDTFVIYNKELILEEYGINK